MFYNSALLFSPYNNSFILGQFRNHITDIYHLVTWQSDDPNGETREYTGGQWDHQWLQVTANEHLGSDNLGVWPTNEHHQHRELGCNTDRFDSFLTENYERGIYIPVL